MTTRDIVFDEQAFLQIQKSAEEPSINSAPPPQVLIPDIPPPTHNPDIPPLTPSKFPSSHTSAATDRELIVDIPVHQIPLQIDAPLSPPSVSETLNALDNSSLSSDTIAPVNSSN